MSKWMILNEGTELEKLINTENCRLYYVRNGDRWGLETHEDILAFYSEAEYQEIKNNLLERNSAINRNSNMDDLANALVGMLEQNHNTTLRDMFAAAALQGLMAAWGAYDVTDFNEISCDAYNLADAMLKEREK